MKTTVTRLIMLCALVMAGIAPPMTRSFADDQKRPHDNGIQYHSGPIFTSTPNVYFIWYGNWTGNSAVNILTDLITSLGGSPYFRINTTYTDLAGNRPSGGLIYGGSAPDQYSHGATLTEADVADVVTGAILSFALPLDSLGIYIVFGSADVSAIGFCTRLCQFHQEHDVLGTTVQYAFVGNPDRCPSVCATQRIGPNGNAGADAMASWVAHVLNGAITNPTFQGWFDKRGRENSDKCEFKYDKTYVVANGAHANVKLGTRDYLLQENWVNANGGRCALHFP